MYTIFVEIFKTHSIEVLFDKHDFLDLIEQYAPELTTERWVVFVAMEAGVYINLFKVDSCSEGEQSTAFRTAVDVLHKKYAMDIIWAEQAVLWFVACLGWNLAHKCQTMHSETTEVSQDDEYDKYNDECNNELLSGNSDELYEMGKRHYNEKSYVLAQKYLEAAEAQEHIYAKALLGICYYEGRGVEINKDTAIEYFRSVLVDIDKLTVAKQAAAEFFLGYCYYNSIVVDKDERLALSHWKRAAEQKYDLAQYWMGEVYYKALCGARRSYKKAKDWYGLAASNGVADAKAKYDEIRRR